MLDRNLILISQVTRTTIPTTRSNSYGTTKCFAEANHTAIGVSRRFGHVTSGSSGLVDSSSAAVLWHEPVRDLGVNEFPHLRCRRIAEDRSEERRVGTDGENLEDGR